MLPGCRRPRLEPRRDPSYRQPMNLTNGWIALLAGALLAACSARTTRPDPPVRQTDGAEPAGAGKVRKSEAEWRAQLTPEQFRVMRQGGTERAYSGDLLHNEAEGSYVCGSCGQALFDSKAKYDSQCGWPSFWQPVDALAVAERDAGEVQCSRCDAHLGHVFPDGPRPTGLRY
jgi:peptide-methionine (R)-S-oxide reductase